MKTAKIKYLLIISSFIFTSNFISLESIKAQVTQQWFQAYNYAYNTSSYGYKIKCDKQNNVKIKCDKQNNVYLLGITRITPESQPSICLIKFNPNGVTQWIARYDNGFNAYNYPGDMTIDSSGNIYIVGTSQRDSLGNSSDLVLLKYSNSGLKLMEKRYSGNTNYYYVGGKSLCFLNDIIYISGLIFEENGGNGVKYCATFAYNLNGDLLWIDKYGGNDGRTDCHGLYIGYDKDNNIYTGGYSFPDSLSYNEGFFVQKFTPNGTNLWRKSTFFYWRSYPYAMEVSPNGNVYLGGGINHSSSSSLDMGIVKYDSSGNLIWTKIFSHEFENNKVGSYDYIHDIKIDKKENVYFTGRDIVPGNFLDIATGKVDSSGNTIWLNHFDPRASDDDVGISLALDDSNNVYVTGITGFSQGSDVVTLRINNNGEFKWHKIFSSISPSSSDEGHSIAIDTQSNILVGGFSGTTPSTVDMIAIKYSQSTNINSITTNIDDFKLFQNYPNPFNPVTTISFTINNKANYELKIFDITGKQLVTILNKQLNSGSYNVSWDASAYPSGIYFYGLYKDGEKFDMKKMILIK